MTKIDFDRRSEYEDNMGQNGKKHCVREEKKLSRLLSDYGRT
jgi:hypothetical protein